MAFWIDNQCYSSTAREDFVNELKTHIQVDDFGTCFQYTCDEECFIEKSQKYLFFLAFENNFCPDYISRSKTCAFFQLSNSQIANPKSS